VRRWLRLAGLLAGGATLLAITPGVAAGFWLRADGSHSARATAAVLPAGHPPTGAAVAGRTVTVRFPLSVVAGVPLADYRLVRYPAGGGTPAASWACHLADAAGCTEAGVPDGTWVYTDTPVRGSWQGTESRAGRPVQVDGTAPAVGVAELATRDRTPLLTGTAGTRPGDARTVTVRVYARGRLLQTRTVAAAGGRWRLAARALPADAGYTVRVRQADAAGNVGEAAARLVIDRTAPTVRLAGLPALVGGRPRFTGTAGTARDAAGHSADAPTVTVRVWAAGGGVVQTLTAAVAHGRWSVTSPGLPSGRYVVRAVQADAAGNEAVTGPRRFAVDASPPAVTVAGGPTADPAPVLRGTAGTAHGDAGTVTVRVTDAAGRLVRRQVVRVVRGGWSARLAGLAPNARYAVTVAQADALGNVGRASAGLTVDTAAPVVTLTAAGPSADPAGAAVTGTAGAAADSPTTSADAATVTVRVYSGPSVVRELAVPVTAGAFSVAVALPPGTYTAEATQRDAAGNLGRSAPVTLTVPASAFPSSDR